MASATSGNGPEIPQRERLLILTFLIDLAVLVCVSVAFGFALGRISARR